MIFPQGFKVIILLYTNFQCCSKTSLGANLIIIPQSVICLFPQLCLSFSLCDVLKSCYNIPCMDLFLFIFLGIIWAFCTCEFIYLIISRKLSSLICLLLSYILSSLFSQLWQNYLFYLQYLVVFHIFYLLVSQCLMV